MTSVVPWILLWCLFIGTRAADPYHATISSLKNKLLNSSTYDKYVLPRTNNDSISLKIGMALLSIDNLNVEADILTSHIWLRMQWVDERLSWKPESFDGHSAIRLSSSDIWQPDIVPYNNADSEFGPSAEYMAVVDHSGSVMYIPHIRLSTSCPVSLTQFPFDQQICIIKLGSWTYSGEEISLKVFGTEDLDLSVYHPNKLWSLVDHSSNVTATQYDCCPEAYYDYTVKLTLKRNSEVIMNIYSGPAICVGLLIPAVFLLPSESSHKLIFSSSLLISHLLILDMLLEVMPINDFTAPKLGLYYLANIVLISLSMAFSAITICLWEKAKKGGDGVPGGVKQVFLGVFGRLLCVRRDDFIIELDSGTKPEPTNQDDHSSMVKEYTRLVAPAEWRQLSVVLDRLLLILFLMVAIATAVALMGYSGTA